MMATSEAQKRASAKYDSANTKRYAFKVNKKTESDIYEWLEQQDKAQTAIKAILKDYIKNKKAVE